MMTLVYLLVAMLVVAVPLLTARRFGFAPGGGPLVLVALCLFLGVPMKVAYTYLSGDALDGPWFSRPEAFFQEALVYLLLFSCTTSVGYILAVRHGERFTAGPLIRQQAVPARTSIALMIMCAAVFSVVIFAFLQTRSAIGSVADVLDIETIATLNRAKLEQISRTADFGASGAAIIVFLGVVWFSFIVMICSALSDRSMRVHVVAVAFLIFLVLVETIIRGKRLSLANMIIFFVIAAVLVRGTLTRKTVLRAVGGFGLIMVIFGIMSVFRKHGAYFDAAGLDDTIALISGQVFGSTYFTDVNNLGFIMWKMEDRELLYGDSFSRIFSAFIPRAFWPDKPAISIGIFVRAELYGISRSIGGFNTPMPTEAYMNFGWGGALIGLIYGAVLRRFEVWTLSARNILRFGSAWIYVFVLIPLTWAMMQTTFALAMVSVITSTILAFAVAIPVARVTRRRMALVDAAERGESAVPRLGAQQIALRG